MKLFGILLLSLNCIFAGGWTKKKGKSFSKLGFRYLSANRIYLPNGEDSKPFGQTKILNYSLYSEYGINDRLTGIVNIPFYKNLKRDAFEGKTGEEESGFGDLLFGFRYGFNQDQDFVFAISALAEIAVANIDSSQNLLLGDGENSFRLALELGHSFNTYKSYFSVSLGYHFRGSNEFEASISDEVLFEGELGHWLSSSLLVNSKLNAVFPNSDIEKQSVFVQSQYLAISFGVFYKLSEQVGLVAEYSTAKKVKNYFKSSVLSAGISFNF